MPTTKKKIEKAKNLCVIDQIVIKRISKSAWPEKMDVFMIVLLENLTIHIL